MVPIILARLVEGVHQGGYERVGRGPEEKFIRSSVVQWSALGPLPGGRLDRSECYGQGVAGRGLSRRRSID